MTTRIPVSGPWITDKEVEYVADAARNAWYANANVYHDRFERAFREYLGVSHVMALPSCTSAIHIALAARGIGPGDEVVVPDVTWIATAAPISYVGATPVFADMDPNTWCMTAKSFEKCITPRTRAVIVVDLYGGMPEMQAIHDIAKSRGIFVLEDSAEAIGSEISGLRAGSFGDASVFSFHGSKTLTTGEGGLLATNDAELFKRAGLLRDHGRAPGKKMFWNDQVAFKYKMSSMQAALGLAQLERIDELVARKRRTFDWYREELSAAGVTNVQLNAEPSGTKNSYWMTTLIDRSTSPMAKEDLIDALSEHGVDSRPFFYPLSSLPAYESSPDTPRARKANEVSYGLSPYGVNLPSGLMLSREDVKRVASALAQTLNR